MLQKQSHILLFTLWFAWLLSGCQAATPGTLAVNRQEPTQTAGQQRSDRPAGIYPHRGSQPNPGEDAHPGACTDFGAIASDLTHPGPLYRYTGTGLEPASQF